MLLKDRTIVIMGVANERSIAWGITKSLHEQGAKLIFTYRKERSYDRLVKLLEENDIQPLLTVACDVLDDASVTAAFAEIENAAGTIHGLVHSIAFAGKDELQGEYVDTSREGYMMAQNSSAYSILNFIVGDQAGLNKAQMSQGDVLNITDGYINTGLNAFFQYPIMFDLANGVVGFPNP